MQFRKMTPGRRVRGVPIPEIKKSPRSTQFKYRFHEFRIGDSAWWPTSVHRVATAACGWKRYDRSRRNRKFVTRKEGRGTRIWRIR